MAADSLLVDTNILLTATSPSRRLHRQALEVLDEWPSRVRLCTSGQILREYLVVATRPEEDNGLGLEQEEALANVRAFLERMRFLDEGRAVHERLRGILLEVDCAGKQIHDANVVATAQSHAVGSVLTQNADDFRRFAHLVEVVPLTDG